MAIKEKLNALVCDTTVRYGSEHLGLHPLSYYQLDNGAEHCKIVYVFMEGRGDILVYIIYSLSSRWCYFFSPILPRIKMCLDKNHCDGHWDSVVNQH